MSNSIEKGLTSRERVNRREFLKKALFLGTSIGAGVAVSYGLERLGPLKDDSDSFVEKGPKLTEDHLWDRVFGVTPGPRGSYLLAAITSPPDPELKFYREPVNEISDEKFFPQGNSYFQAWRPDGFCVTSDSSWVEIGEYDSDVFLYDRTLGAKLTLEKANKNKIFEDATISFRGAYLSYVRVEEASGEYSSYFGKRTIVLVKTPGNFTSETRVELDFEIAFSEKHDLRVPPTFSPDEKYLAYVTNEPKYPETNPDNINNQTPVLRIFNIETRHEKDVPLFYGVGRAEKLAWSPDSKNIAVYSSDDEQGYIAKRELLNLLDVDNNELKTVELDPDYYNFPERLSEGS